MTALKRRLQSGLPNNLYWFAHRRSDLERLRSLSKDHRDLCLVLPDKPTKAATEPPPASEEKLAGAAGEGLAGARPSAGRRIRGSRADAQRTRPDRPAAGQRRADLRATFFRDLR